MKSKLAVAALLLAVAVAQPIRAQQINTEAGWNGSDYAVEFGAPNTATYGQTFTANGSLTDFSFWFSNSADEGGGALQFKAYIGTWTGTEVGTILWSSSGTYTGNGTSTFQQYLFTTGGVNLTGGEYVAFVNASPYILANESAIALEELGADQSNPYADGAYVFTNNGDNFNGIFNAWEQTGDDDDYGDGYDLAFVANFGNVTPEPASLTLLATGLVGLVGAGARRRKKA